MYKINGGGTLGGGTDSWSIFWWVGEQDGIDVEFCSYWPPIWK